MKLMKTQILKKAIFVISRDGIRNFRPKDVAEEAGCSEALIYHHFGTKRGLIDACYTYISRGLQRSLSSAELAAGDYVPAWRALFSFLGDDRDTARFLTMYLLEMTDGLPDELGYLRDVIKQGHIGEGMDPADLEAFSVKAARMLVLVACIYCIDGAGIGQHFAEQYRGLQIKIADGFSERTESPSPKAE
jgi:AcrR family transcriptional regulator